MGIEKTKKQPQPVSGEMPPSQRRIQTAEGWKRSQLKKLREAKEKS